MSGDSRHSPVWAYVGTVVGGVASLAANVAHCFIAPLGAPGGWTPEVGAVASAVFWPVALFVAVEILVRTPWPAGRWWLVGRFGGLLPVALVAAVVSYRHLSGLLHHYGEDTLTAVAGPAAVDGLMVMAATALLAASHTRAAEPGAAPSVAARQTAPAQERGAGAAADRGRAASGGIPSGVVR